MDEELYTAAMHHSYLSVAMYILLTTSNKNAFSIPLFCVRKG